MLPAQNDNRKEGSYEDSEFLEGHKNRSMAGRGGACDLYETTVHIGLGWGKDKELLSSFSVWRLLFFFFGSFLFQTMYRIFIHCKNTHNLTVRTPYCLPAKWYRLHNFPNHNALPCKGRKPNAERPWTRQPPPPKNMLIKHSTGWKYRAHAATLHCQ